jgi:NAD(P)-dependent dehydrogenase (short-subunit alcohol dehydrogenase family)
MLEDADADADAGADVLAVQADVSQAAEIEALADKAFDRFGGVHLLCNNAGVGSPGRTVWGQTIADWEWVLGVNLWGVIHGVRTFVPRMLAPDVDCHIVNTASIAGLTSSPWRGAYAVAKHGVVTLTEMLQQELALEGDKLRASVLCPGFVDTRIQQSKRNRPESLANASADDEQAPGFAAFLKLGSSGGMAPADVASMVFDAVREQRFYVITHPHYLDSVRDRVDRIIDGRDPGAIAQG